MRNPIGLIAIVCIVAGSQTYVFAEGQLGPAKSKAVAIPQSAAKAKPAKVQPAALQPFQVQSVQFQEVSHTGATRLAVAVIFNKEIDPATVQPNVNIRLLRKNEQHFWVDATTQGNVVNVRPKHITRLSGAPFERALYIMHLRGTIKSKDGLYLDCNKDGKGEGGSLPAYESQMYDAVHRLLETIEDARDAANN